MAVVIAIDAGTTGVRALAVDETGRPVAVAYREFPQHYPAARLGRARPRRDLGGRGGHPGQLVAERLRRTPVAAIGITNQRETTVVWDRRTGRPLPPGHRLAGPAHGAPAATELEAAGHLALIRARTGLVLDPYFSATKMEWLLAEGGVDAGPGLAFGTVDTWLMWQPDRRAPCTPPTRPTPAAPCSSTSGRRRWDARAGRLFDVPPRCLPEVAPVERPVRRHRGRRHRRAARRGARSAGWPATSRPRSSARPASGPGMTKNTYGTGSFVLMNVGDRCPDAGATACSRAWPGSSSARRPSPTPSRAPSSSPAPPSSGCATGSASSPRRPRSGRWPAAVADTDGVYLVPAFTGLGSPWWDPYARGTIVGLTTGRRAGPPGPGRGRGHGLPDPRRRRRHDGGGRPRRGRAAGRRRRVGHGPAAAAPGRPARGPGGPAQRRRDHRPRAPPTWPGWPRACGGRSTSWRPVAPDVGWPATGGRRPSSWLRASSGARMGHRRAADARPVEGPGDRAPDTGGPRHRSAGRAGVRTAALGWTRRADRVHQLRPPVVGDPGQRRPAAAAPGRGTGDPAGRGRRTSSAASSSAQATSSGPPSSADATETDARLPATNAPSHGAGGAGPTLTTGTGAVQVDDRRPVGLEVAAGCADQGVEQRTPRSCWLDQHRGRLEGVEAGIGRPVGGGPDVLDVDAVDLGDLGDQQRHQGRRRAARRAARRWPGRRPARGCRCRPGRPGRRRCGWRPRRARPGGPAPTPAPRRSARRSP